MRVSLCKSCRKQIKTYFIFFCALLSRELCSADDLASPKIIAKPPRKIACIKAATSKYLQSCPGGITTKSLLCLGKHVATCVKALKPSSLCLSRRIKLAQRVAENRLKGERCNFSGLGRRFLFFLSLFCSREIDPFVGLVGRCAPHNFALHSK